MKITNRRIIHFAIIIIFVGCLANVLYAGDYITPEQTDKHIGEVQTVCGVVASTHYSTKSNRQPTFLNLNKPYPKHIFTALIWGADRNKFKNQPEVYFAQKRICVTGKIEEYRGKPEIIVKDPSQISVKE